MSSPLNVATRLSEVAHLMPNNTAIVEPLGYDRSGKRNYRQLTFRQLDDDSSRIAFGLRQMGVVPGTRLALLVRPGIDFISLVFALLKSGAVSILIDPGMGRSNLIDCLSEAKPEGFVAVPIVHAVRLLKQRKFPLARINVTVGRRWFWGGPTLRQLRATSLQSGEVVRTLADDPAAIIFTTGSTGAPKGVLFSHANFDAQVEQIRDRFDIRPGEIDLPAFPLFGLFNCAMGVTAVIPDMDPTRPAQVDPNKIIEAIRDWNITQTFGSPAVWNRVGKYCEEKGIKLSTVRRVLSSGAPVPVDTLRRMKSCIHEEGDMHTPYGATEALPVASIAASEVLKETAQQSRLGAGTCVGRKFQKVNWKVIRIVDGTIRAIDDVEELPIGEIGELIVNGPQVTKCYVTRTEANAMAKITDNKNGIWHRMGDSGYFDAEGRFWFCGRVAHRVITADGPLYPIQCEAIFNQHPCIFRSALVGIGLPGKQRPIIILEPQAGQYPVSTEAQKVLLEEIRQLGKCNPITKSIDDFLFHPSFPVDIRHNAKIFREKLSVWAEKQLNA